MNERSDWIAWSLQLVAGFVAGAFCSVFFIGGPRGIPLIAPGSILIFVMGAALVGAAFASHYGDRLWMGSLYRVIPPEEPQHSAATRRASFAVGYIGGALVLVALGRSFGLLT